MWVLVDVYGDNVICNKEYKDLEEAKKNLDVDFFCFINDNNIEYKNHCFQINMSAWARLNGKYRIWNIIEVLP